MTQAQVEMQLREKGIQPPRVLKKRKERKEQNEKSKKTRKNEEFKKTRKQYNLKTPNVHEFCSNNVNSNELSSHPVLSPESYLTFSLFSSILYFDFFFDLVLAPSIETQLKQSHQASEPTNELLFRMHISLFKYQILNQFLNHLHSNPSQNTAEALYNAFFRSCQEQGLLFQNL